MPQENGWATGPEHCDEDGRVCPYCGSDNTESGSLDTQAGQVVESGCECFDCEMLWSNLYNIQGWYDAAKDLHEDTRDIDTREHTKTLREALREIAGTSANENSDPDRMADALGEIQGIVRKALEATKEGA